MPQGGIVLVANLMASHERRLLDIRGVMFEIMAV